MRLIVPAQNTEERAPVSRAIFLILKPDVGGVGAVGNPKEKAFGTIEAEPSREGQI